MEDPDFSFWACTQAITDGPDDGSSSRENPAKVDDFGYIVLNNMANNECFILKEGENTIGRHPLNNIYIEHPSVSMSHAVIQCDSDGVVLLDKGSLNKTRLNKKILKKNVAYFLDENALLIFGEVQANYYVDTVPSEFTNVKASNDTLVQRTTGIHGVSVPKLSNTIITPNDLCAIKTSNTISGTNVSLVTENSSAGKTETTVLNLIAESDHAKSNLNDVHSDLNSPSPSDEFLLDAISQIESNEIKVNYPGFLLSDEDTSSPVMNLEESLPITHMPRIDNDILSVSHIQRLCTEIMPEVTREDTPSPVMDLGPLIDYDDRSSVQETDNHNVPKTGNSSPEQDLTQSIPTEHVLKMDNNIPLVSDMQALCTEVMTEATREDTPSPIMDLGPLINYDNSLSVQETDNHGILSSNKSSDEGGELSETQLMSVENNVSENCTQMFPANNLPNTNIKFQVSKTLSDPTTLNDKNEFNMIDECTQLPIMDNGDLLSLTSKSISVNHNSQIEDEKSSDLGTFKKIKNDSITKKIELNNSTSLTKKSSASKEEYITEHDQNIFDEDDDIFISVDQKIELLKTQNKNILHTTKIDNNFLNKSEPNKMFNENPSTSMYCHFKTETVLTDKSICKQSDNTFEADDDDIFKDFIQKEFNSQSHTSTRKIEKKMSNCPLQKVSLSLNEKETQSFPEISPQCRNTYLDSSNTVSTCKSNDLNLVSDLADDDFFNCPTQKVSISKKMNEMKKLSQSIHEQETQPIQYLPIQPRKTDLDTPNTTSTSKSKGLNSKIDDEDIFNCSTQKVSISKKLNEIKKPSLSIHEQETQPIPDLSSQSRRAYPSISTLCSTSKNKELNFEMDDDDFFNCSTQKVSLSKNMKEIKKQSLSIHEQETQPIPNLPTQSREAYPSMSIFDSTNKNKNLNFEIDEDDFFNCATQKVSISKKINEMKKLSLSILDQETQPIQDLPTQHRKIDLVMTNITSSSKSKYLNHKIDDEDFFNCPTQKLSVSKKMDDIKKPSLSLHEQETQPIPDLPTQSIKAYSSKSILGSTSKDKDLNFEMNDNDFFNCPTQKVSISKKIKDMKKPSLSIHEQETQPIPDLPTQSIKSYPSKSILGSTSKDKDLNFETDDNDFFNCPIQKVSISKKLKEMIKPSLSIHEQETQPIPNVPTKSRNAYSSTPITGSTNKNSDVPFELDDDDFFNCPTQKVSISKKINEMKKPSLAIHEQETQPIQDLPTQPRKTDLDTSNITSSSKSKDLNPEVDDEDFFNCPTQKVSISKKLNEIKKPSLFTHEKETQQIPDLPTQSIKAYSSKSILGSTSKDKNFNFEMDDNDFFNCPTQKVSISKNIKDMKKPSLSIHEQETQPIPNVTTQSRNAYSSTPITESTNKNSDVPFELDDDDFFNCPTQKVSISKKINEMKKLSQSIHEQETQLIQDLPTQPRKTDLDTSNTTSISKSKNLNPEVDDEDFFNCPTQKVSISKKLNETKKPLSMHEQETQPIPDLPSQPIKNYIGIYNTNSTIKSIDLNPEINKDFFNCPTQPLPDNSPLSNIRKRYFNNQVISSHKDSTQAPEMDEDFFNCPTQPLPDKLLPNTTNTTIFNSRATISHKDLTRETLDDENSLNRNTQIPSSYGISSTNFHKQNIFNINEAETQELSPVEISTVSIVKINAPDKIKQNKENIFNCSTQKASTKILLNANKDETEGQAFGNNGIPYGTKSNIIQGKSKRFCSNDISDKHELLNQKLSVVSDPTDMHMIRKSSRIHSMSINKPNIQLSAAHNQNIKKSKTNNKPIIRVRKDLHVTGSNNSVKYPDYINKSNQNAGENNSKTSTNNNIVQPSGLKNSTDDDSDLILLASIDRELLSDESVQHQVKDVYSLRRKNHSKQKNETVLSISKEPSTCRNLSLNQHKNPVAIQSSSIINIVQPSCSKIPDDDSDLILLASIKKELLGNESEQHQLEDFLPLRHKDYSKQKNEATFSNSNEPCASTNSPLDQHQNPIPIQSNVDLPNCQPSTSNSNDSSSQWKSFWNQKKMSSQYKGKSGNQKNTTNTNDIVKKERYQTRANTKRDHSVEVNKKRKQDVNIEECNKRMCKDNMEDRLNLPVQGTSDIVVTFSYLKSRNLLEMKQFVETTGGYVTDEIAECTVLVTDKVRCSMKVLSAIAKGCPIVDANWVKHSYTVKMFQDVDEFIISDKDAERKHKFKLKESLARAKAKGLLDGYTVMVTPSVKPSPKDMKVIITCAGGNYVMNWPKKRHPNELIVTCEQDRRRWKPLWDNNKAKTIDNDAFIMSIMRQKLSV